MIIYLYLSAYSGCKIGEIESDQGTPNILLIMVYEGYGDLVVLYFFH